MNQRVNLWLGLPTGLLMLAAIYMVFAWVPTEADQGIVQRIFYFHVPCAWVAFAAFGARRDLRYFLPMAGAASMG